MNFLKRRILGLIKSLDWHMGQRESHDILLESYFHDLQLKSENPLSKTGYSFFSQFDEDAILSNILARINVENSGNFIELGVGNGLQNNTLNLLFQNYSGLWVGGQNLAFDASAAFQGRLKFEKAWITLDYLDEHQSMFLDRNTDVFSMDLDGNDWHFAKFLLEHNFRPNVWVQEYNSNIPPLSNWKMNYDASHTWDGGMNWGASLSEYANLLEEYGYKLVACNATGVNSFFIRGDFAQHFSDIPADVLWHFNPYRPWFMKSKQRVDPLIFDY